MSDEEKVEIVRDSSGKPRPDDTPPQNGIILVSAVLVVLTLFSLKYVFDSYLDTSNLGVRRAHIAESHASEVLADYRATSQDQLRGGQMPISDAMEQLATRGRSAFVQIRPVADTTTAAREGWSAMPVTAGEPAPHAQAVAEPEAPAPEAPPATDAAPAAPEGAPEAP
ncbi:MAG: hypothetical protein U0234_01125 [Sandaracinus sp.]